jgi:hypothetical protein
VSASEVLLLLHQETNPRCHITATTLRTWVHRGHITRGTGGYDLREILTYITTRERTMDELPTVARVADEHGSHIEPPLDENWTSLEKLRWRAACVRLASPDLPIGVRQYEGDPPTYGLVIGNTGVGDMPFHQCWTYLNGVETGLSQVA